MLITFSSAQELLNIENRSIPVDYFQENYARNLEAEGLKNSLNTFLNFELMYQDALNKKIDTISDFQFAFNKAKHKKRIQFILSQPIIDSIIQSDYYKANTDRTIEFITVFSKENKNSDKTLKKANSLFQEYTNGKSINQILKENSYVKGSSEYFIRGGLDHPDLEQIVFNVEVGNVIPVTQINNGFVFGKVLNDSKVLENITIQSIAIDSKQNNSEKTINEIHAQLLEGANFDQLVKLHHSNEELKKNYGVIPYFGKNIPVAIQEIVNPLNSGEFSKPKLIDNQWVIYRVFKIPTCSKSPRSCYDEFLNQYVKSNKILDAEKVLYRKKVSKMIQPTIFQNNVYDFISDIPESFYNQSDTLNISTNKSIIEINKTPVLNTKNFATLFNGNQNKIHNEQEAIEYAIEELNQQKIQLSLNEYHKNLEQYEPEFASILEILTRDYHIAFYQEYLDKLATEDVKGQKEFYKKNIYRYSTDNRVNLDIYSSDSEGVINSVFKDLKNRISFIDIKNKYNSNKNLTALQGELLNTDFRLPKKVGKKSVQQYQKNGKFYAIKIHDKIPAGPIEYDKVKLKVLKDYKQEYLLIVVEKLKETIDYQFNDAALEQLKNKYAE